MEIILIVGILVVFAVGCFAYMIYRFVKAENDLENDLNWQDHPFDDKDTFYDNKKGK